MEKEMLNIYDDEGNHSGTATREEVHKKGHWHETFHCWFIKKIEGKTFLYFQLRSPHKKDYPSQLDITAAGHILSHETFHDGVREVEEETGIVIEFEDLVPLGMIPYQVVMEDFIDRERAHIFLYEFDRGMNDFSLQAEEVTGMYHSEIESFERLIMGEEHSVELEGFKLDSNGDKIFKKRKAAKSDFVPHEDSYYLQILNNIREYITKNY